MRAWRNAVTFINRIYGDDGGEEVSGQKVQDLIMSYAYESYASQAYFEGKRPELSKADFEELIEDPRIKPENSNVAEMLVALSSSIESTLSALSNSGDDKKKMTAIPPE